MDTTIEEILEQYDTQWDNLEGVTVMDKPLRDFICDALRRVQAETRENLIDDILASALLWEMYDMGKGSSIVELLKIKYAAPPDIGGTEQKP
jgi:hypothetical protein